MTSERDAAAFKAIYDTRAVRLGRATARAEKWIAGLSALVTVLTAAMVVKGPENFAKAAGSARGLVLGLVIVGIVGVASGLVFAYSAAFGGLFKMSAVDELIESPPSVAAGSAGTLETAASADAVSSRRSMRVALAATVFAMVALTGAIGVSWFVTPKDRVETFVCLQTGSGIVRLAGPVTVKDGVAVFVACP